MDNTVIFYARVKDKILFDNIEFYANDIKILKELGYRVILVNKIKELLYTRAKFYYCWWFGYSIYPLIMAKLLNKKIIITGNLHTIDCRGLDGWPFTKKLIMKLVMKFADCSIFTSKKEIMRLGKFAPKNIKLMYHCVDDTVYKNDDINKENIIVTVSQLTTENVKRKKLLENILAFKEVIRKIPNAKYYLCGMAGDGLVKINELIDKENLHGRVVVKTNISRNEKISLLKKSKVYLQQTACEGFGLAVLEAQACGVPVITNSDPVLYEVYQDSVIYKEALNAVANEIIKLLINDDYLESRIDASLNNASKYTMRERKKILADILQENGLTISNEK